MEPIIISDIKNHQYEIHLNNKVRYLDFTKSNQIDLIINEMIMEERDEKLNKLI